MTRAGREPAEEVKKRMVAACKDAGLTVWGAKMQFQRDLHQRFIKVDAVWPHGACQKSVIAVYTAVGTDGSWPGTVTIGTSAGVDGLDANRWDIPIMFGREAVPLECLADQLRATIQEREQVAADRRNRVSGPWVFGEAWWDSPPPDGGTV